MPMRWAEPDLFLVHGGVPIWQVYEGPDDPSWFSYTSVMIDDDADEPRQDEDECGQFDVRDLPGYDAEKDADTGDAGYHVHVIRTAIDAGYFIDRDKDAPPPTPAASDKIKIAVFVEGGCVSGVTSNHQDVEVVIVDRDNHDEKGESETREADQDAAECNHKVY